MSARDRFEFLVGNPAAGSDFGRKTVRSGAYALAGEGVDFFIRLASVVILARLLLPEHFGLIAMVTAVTMIAERFKDLGLTAAAIQSPTLSHEQASTLFWVNVGAGWLMAGCVAGLAYPLVLFYDDPRLFHITLAIALTFLWSGFASQHYALLRRAMKYREIAVIQVAASVLSVIVAVAMAMNGFGYWALVGREVARSIFLSVGAWIFLPWIPGGLCLRSGVGRMLKFGADITAFNFVFLVAQSIDQLLVGKVLGAHALGVYRQGYQLVLAPMNQLAYPVRVVMESALSRLQHDAEAYRHYYRYMLTVVAFVTFPLGLFMATYSKELVTVLLGPAWLEAIPVFRILAIAATLYPAGVTAGAVMVTCGLSRRLFWIGLASAVVLVALLVAGLPFGVVGIASAHLVATWVFLIPKLYWSFHGTPISVRLFLIAIARPAAAAVFMVIILVAWKITTGATPGLATLAAGLLVGVVSYAAAWFIIPGGRAELYEIYDRIAARLGLQKYVPAWALRIIRGRSV
ncbi:lipopolysaccharide biosynthesis protein [Thioalkalicoccus limnaeus]|uniref:Lipopolysaccharide biosynthesis protein n=1 Tax=Thioalkalicoccus limnaeus TaxID=120681 RepID=A0ABV4BE15_9GAMM